MLRKFKDYRETASAKLEEHNLVRPDDPTTVPFTRKLQRTKDSIKDIMLAKLNLIEKGTYGDSSKLTEEQLIEHQMLTMDDEFPFKDMETQANIVPVTKDRGISATVACESVEIETDELMDFLSLENDTVKIDESKPLPVRLEAPKFIVVTDENNEKSIKYSNASSRRESENNEEGKISTKVVFRFRLKMEKNTQTDDKVFIEMMRKEEDEITNWVMQDRERYLRSIQRQIFQKKNELNKVNNLIVQNKSQLGDSLNLDDRALYSLNSSCDHIDSLIDNEIESLRHSGIFGNEIDTESWKQGYYFGYDKGKIEGYAEGEKIGYEKADLDKELNEVLNTSIKEEKKKRKNTRKSTLAIDDIKRTRKSTTKIQEFHFQRKGSRGGTVKIEHKQDLLQTFLSDPLKEIVKNTKMSRKMTLKTISMIYSSIVAKRQTTHATNLEDFTYDEFYSKYGQKVVAAKKFIDFVAALLKYPDSRKVITFSKLLSISKKLGLDDYIRPKECFSFISSLQESISKSTLGIVVGIDETSDYQFIPTIRAIECAKEVISPYIDNAKMLNILDIIDKNSHPDPKKINKSGIIDQELLQEILLNEYDNYYKYVINNLILTFEGITLQKNPERMYKQDFIMLIRHVSPAKFDTLVGNNDPIETLNFACESNPLDQYESIEKLVDVCINYNLLFPADVDGYTRENLTMESARMIITSGLNETQVLLRYVFTHREEYKLSEEYSLIWEQRLAKIQETDIFAPKILVLAWNVLFSEITRITKIPETKEKSL